jgi:hypothetical protein
MLSYKLIEGPIINLKGHMRYGPAQPASTKHEIREQVLVSAGD